MTNSAVKITALTHAVPRVVACPPALRDHLTLFATEEATSRLRHDIRNKLASVRNAVFFVRRRIAGHPAICEAEPRVLQFLKMIDDEATGLGELAVPTLVSVDDAIPKQANPIDVLTSLVDSIMWPSHIVVVTPPRTPTSVQVNPGELAVALFCILENAIDAATSKPEHSIRVELLLGEDRLVGISISDDGTGFGDSPPGLVGVNLDCTKSGRSGVGLRIARRVTTRWGGRLEVERGVPGGARVTLWLHPAIAESIATSPQPACPKRPILLVDDDEAGRLTLAALLEDAGFEVFTAASVGEARRELQARAHVLVILDFLLPDGRGTELVSDAKERNPQTVIAVVSGRDVEECAGVDLFLRKATAPDDLLDMLDRALRDRRKQ